MIPGIVSAFDGCTVVGDGIGNALPGDSSARLPENGENGARYPYKYLNRLGIPRSGLPDSIGDESGGRVGRRG